MTFQEYLEKFRQRGEPGYATFRLQPRHGYGLDQTLTIAVSPVGGGYPDQQFTVEGDTVTTLTEPTTP